MAKKKPRSVSSSISRNVQMAEESRVNASPTFRVVGMRSLSLRRRIRQSSSKFSSIIRRYTESWEPELARIGFWRLGLLRIALVSITSLRPFVGVANVRDGAAPSAPAKAPVALPFTWARVWLVDEAIASVEDGFVPP